MISNNEKKRPIKTSYFQITLGQGGISFTFIVLSTMTKREKNQNDGEFDIKFKKLNKMNQQRMSPSFNHFLANKLLPVLVLI